MSYLLLLLSLLTHKPNNCSCIPLGPISEEQCNAYNLIVKGKVTKLLVKGLEKTIYLKVELAYKGAQNQTTIKITTPSQEGMCGIVPKVGEHWLMFAFSEKKGFRTELCSRTKNMNPAAWDYNQSELTNDIKFLETKFTPRNR